MILFLMPEKWKDLDRSFFFFFLLDLELLVLDSIQTEYGF